MNIKKKIYLAACTLAASPVAVLAEETGGSSSDSGSVSTEIITQASESLEGMLNTAGTVVTDLVIAGLAIWGGIALVGILKRAFSAGKGR